MIISRTPFRISFFGGGSDYPVWYRGHGGKVLATTIDKYCYISCRYLPPFFDYRSRINYSKIELVNSIDEILHPAVRETLRYLNIQEGLEIHHDGDLPARTGLGSSSAFTVGFLHALMALKQIMPTKLQLAKEAIHLEQDILKENVGCQDQVSTAFGGFNRIDFSPNDEIATTPIIFKRERFEEFEKHLLLYFTGFTRTASEIAKNQIEQTKNRVSEITRMSEMVEEGIRILTNPGPLEEFGKLLHESWMLKRSLHPKISTPLIDQI